MKPRQIIKEKKILERFNKRNGKLSKIFSFIFPDKVMADVFSMTPNSAESQREVNRVQSEDRHFIFNCKCERYT